MSDKTITTIPVWGPGYEISFEFYLNSDGGTSSYQYLFGVVSDAANIGYGQPVIFYRLGKLPMWFNGGAGGATLGQWYYPYGGSVTVEVHRWYKLSVSSIKENGKVSMKIQDNF